MSSSVDAVTARALQQAVAAAQRGDARGAIALAEQALISGGERGALNAFIGMVRARSGDIPRAVENLRIAHQAKPTDVTIACNLVANLIEVGELDAAYAVASPELVANDTSRRLIRYRAYLAQCLGQFDEAVQLYRQIVTALPGDFDSWNNLGNALTGSGAFDDAVAALERAVELNPGAAPTRINLAGALRDAGRDHECEQVLRKAAGDFPNDPKPSEELHRLFHALGREQESVEAIDEAVRRAPHDPALQLQAAVARGSVDDVNGAERGFHRAIELDGKLRDAYIGLAVQYEHANRTDDLTQLLEQAEMTGVDDDVLALIRAFVLRRSGRFDEALACADKIPDEVEPVRMAHLRGTCLDRVGRYEEAFGVFSVMNERHIADDPEVLNRGKALRDAVSDRIAMLTPEWVASLPPLALPAGSLPDPVFLVGFPRSGTTLLDTLLMGHPRTVVMEEEPPLNIVDHELGGQAQIPALDAAAATRWRDRYFEEVAKVASVEPGQMLIDKSPLFLHHVPLITRLSPNAKFILALRHPCDVLLSCYMANFKLNPAMANFLRLEDAATLYDQSFALWERARSLIPINVFTVVYEQLIDDVEGTVRPLFDFLGLEWSDAVLDHESTAKNRGLIRTASYSQVTEPIYRRAAGRWRRYEEQLAPVIPIVRPWAEKWGYEV